MRLQSVARSSAGMTAAELRQLPASIDPETAFRAIGVGRTKGYKLLKDGEFPIPVLRLGATYRFRTSDVLELLGVTPAASAGVTAQEPQGAA